MATLGEDIDSAAVWVSEALQGSGYDTDFTPASLWAIERFFDDHSANGVAKPGGLLATNLGALMFAISAYVGEVIRRSLGGEWLTNDDDPDGALNIVLMLDGGGRIWPGQRVLKRFKNGSEDSIAFYGSALGVEVGPAPQQRRWQRPVQKSRRFGRRSS